MRRRDADAQRRPDDLMRRPHEIETSPGPFPLYRGERPLCGMFTMRRFLCAAPQLPPDPVHTLRFLEYYTASRRRYAVIYITAPISNGVAAFSVAKEEKHNRGAVETRQEGNATAL